MLRETITRRSLVARWAAWMAATGLAGAQSRPQAPSQVENTAQRENIAARLPDERAARSLETFEVPKGTEPAFVFQP